MCGFNVTFIAMANKHVNALDKEYEGEELDVNLTDQLVSDADFDDVFKGLDFDCSSELSSLSNEETESSKVPEKQVRKHLVIGKHIKVVEGEQIKYKCTICNCQFTWKQQIRYHDYCVTGKRPLKCELCDKRFVKKSHYVYHMRTHTGESPFKCLVCSKTFKQRDKLKRHEKTHKEFGNGEKFTCGVCKKYYCDRDSLKKHELKHEKTKKNKCKHCDKKYVDKFTLKQHLAAHHQPNYICDVCGRRFFRRNSLNIHMQMHEDVYPHQCSECRKTFRTKKELTQHSVVHNKNNPKFECSLCSIICGRKDNLLRHVRNCHLDPCAKKDLKNKKILEHLKESNNEEQQNSCNKKIIGNNEGSLAIISNPCSVGECSQTLPEQETEHIEEIATVVECSSKYSKAENETNCVLDDGNKDKMIKNKKIKNKKTGKLKNSSSIKTKMLSNESEILASSVCQNAMDIHSNPDNLINKRKSVLVPTSALTQPTDDLPLMEDSNTSSNLEMKVPTSGETSVIVHTSSFIENLVPKTNILREPVIKFSRPENKSETYVLEPP